MAAIIIPAHDEAAVIGATLQAVVAQADAADEIVVCANGCSDATAAIAAAFAPRVRVIVTARASKAAALNLAEAAVSSFPRFYLDADITLQPHCLERLKAALARGPWLAVAPTPTMALAGVSWAVAAYYRVWLSLPYCQQGLIGAGLYALSAPGRARFGEFPPLIADDGFVRRLFEEHERCRVATAEVTVRAPSTLRWLLAIKTRSRLGNLQLERQLPSLSNNERKAYGQALLQGLSAPGRWPALAVYLFVCLYARAAASLRARSSRSYRWQRDLSSRSLTEQGAHGE